MPSSPRVILIAALDRGRVIGIEGRLPWSLPLDLRRFKALTLGKPVVMGRKTWESLPRRPLPGRRNLVLSRGPIRDGGHAEACSSFEQALDKCRGEPEIFVIGGESVYAAALPFAHAMELTLVETETEGDARFPSFDPEEWTETFRERHGADARHALPFSFVSLRRRGGPAAP